HEKASLHEDDRINDGLARELKKSVEQPATEFSRHNLLHTVLPPGRCGFAVMELYPAKLPRIGEHKGALTLIQNKMIVLLWAKIRLCGLYFPAHAEMQA